MKEKFVDTMDFESDTKNWKYSFDYMCKKHGRNFIDYIRTIWSINDGVQTEDEFISMNGINRKFFDKVINKCPGGGKANRA